jgi:mRNA interferase MazF
MGSGGVVAAGIMRGDIRMYSFSAPDKTRPVLVLTRDSVISHLATITVAPITSTARGVASEVVLNEDDGLKELCVVNLHNTTTVLQRLIGKRIAHLSASRMAQVCAALRFSLGCDSNL